MSSDRVRLSNDTTIVEILARGAALERFEIRHEGEWRSILLDRPSGPIGFYFGASCGRFANRIDRARFVLDGQLHELAANEGAHQLHGGPTGFSDKDWEITAHDDTSARFELVSPDGDQGFPGTLTVVAEFELVPGGAQVTYTATTDAPTVLNLTTHPYFNLDGAARIDDHVLTLTAGTAWTVTDAEGIPTGEIRGTAGTAADFRSGVRFGSACDQGNVEGITRNNGYDHNFVVAGDGLREHARLSVTGGPTLIVRSDAPGVQIYGGDHIARAGLAIEPQNYPDAPNHDTFPSSVLRPGEVFRTLTQWLIG